MDFQRLLMELMKSGQFQRPNNPQDIQREQMMQQQQARQEEMMQRLMSGQDAGRLRELSQADRMDFLRKNRFEAPSADFNGIAESLLRGQAGISDMDRMRMQQQMQMPLRPPLMPPMQQMPSMQQMPQRPQPRFGTSFGVQR